MSTLAEILKEDTWKSLHPATKLVVKVLQHIRDKLNDGAEIRAYFDNEEILITTYKSEIRISENGIGFKRRTARTLRVQRAKVKLTREILDTIKNEILVVLESDVEPNYAFIVEVLEKHFAGEEACAERCP